MSCLAGRFECCRSHERYLRGAVTLLVGSLMLENEMEKRTATCRCGQLKVTCEGEPVRILVCTAWTARSGAAAPLQRRRDGQRRELCSLADQKRGSVWLTAGTGRLTSSALIAARRSHTSSKAGPAWSQCPSAHLRTPPSRPQNSPSTSTVSTRGLWCWAKPWSIPLRQVSCAILAR